jgi:hypothetical protein
MDRSYAVAWQNGDGVQYAGRLDLDASSLTLEGGKGAETIEFSELAGVHADGNAMLLVTRDGRSIRVVSIGELGARRELLEEISARRSRASGPPAQS